MKNTEKRKMILTAAVSLFSRTHNIKKVSLEAIAAEAHVSPTTIYNNFGDRENLVFEAVKELTKTTIERNRALIHSNLPFAQKITSVISSKMDMTEKMNSEIIKKMLSHDKNISPFIDEIYESDIKPLWAEMLEQGKKEGYIDQSIDTRACILYLDIIQAGLKVKADVFQKYKDNMGLIKQLTRLMFYGFLKKDFDLFQKEDKTS